jgi:hypothetical protein
MDIGYIPTLGKSWGFTLLKTECMSSPNSDVEALTFDVKIFKARGCGR